VATAGPRKKLGPIGPKGDTPAHEWSGTQLRFENPDGTWGEYEELRGPPGKQGKRGEDGKNGLHGAPGSSGVGVPPGGLTGEVLTKLSNNSYDTYWTAGGGGGPATQAPKLIAEFDTDAGTSVTDLVRVNGNNSVTKITDNLATTIPNGVFGVVTAKASAILANVIFVGIQSGYSGFTTGEALYIDTDGTPTHTAPSTGTLQQIGFAISASSFFVYLQNPIRRS